MKTKHAKKIIAVIGAALLGIGGASAALNDYPEQFIENNAFNGKLVIGSESKSEDVVGAIEIATALQARTVRQQVSSGDGDTFVVDGFRIQRSGNPLVFGRYLADIQDTPLDATDFPKILKRGTYDDEEGQNRETVEYDQEVEFSANNGRLRFYQDDDDAPTGQPYVEFVDNQNVLTYTLEFTEDVDIDQVNTASASQDIENTRIEILGQSYLISDARAGSNGRITGITLLAGETTVWLTTAETISRSIEGISHDITLIGVSENEDRCLVQVDGTTQGIAIGQTRNINGVEIAVSEAFSNGISTCEVNLGATTINIENGEEIEFNDQDIEGSEASIMSSGGVWSGFNITFEPEEETYLAAGESWIDPIFNAFKITFGGMEDVPVEVMNFQASGDEVTFTFPNRDEREVEITWIINENDFITMGTGSSNDERIFLEGEACEFSSTIEECEGAQFLVITQGGEAHLMEVDNFDTNDNKITIEDRTYDAENEEDFDESVTSGQQLSLSAGAGTITLTAANSSLEFTNIDLSTEGAITDGDAKIRLSTLNATAQNAIVVHIEEDEEDGLGGNIFAISLNVDGEDLEIQSPQISTGAFIEQAIASSEDNDDDVWFVTNWTTRIRYDQEDKQSLHITYPARYQEGMVFFSEFGEPVEVGQDGELISLEPIEVGSSVLDTEVDDSIDDRNLIVIGGPCVNTVAAELLGRNANVVGANNAACTQGFTPNQAMLRLFEHASGNVAVLVAGYSGDDTRRAARVLADFATYESEIGSRDQVVVRGTSLEDIDIISTT